ncbi:hypothetical protein BHE90_007488 [Fusarium euwallaceae]|uniref:G domain-containing protein n=1 Tax=Fusarium euwallaceae TaxID=1147111 RepID=A0A430LQK0_9HYPO|nr:hypothetical protein BHE90_007488 [Fusarium euwallaceae]
MAEHSECRPALGLPVKLGALYDACSEKVLSQSILKTATIPPDLIVEQDLPRVTYRHSTTDCLEERFENLEISAEIAIGILCGMISPRGSGEYLSQRKSSDRLQQASAVCTLRTKHEKLHVGEELKPYLNMDAFESSEATHVVCQIEWGAQVVVTAKAEARDGSNSSNLQASLAAGDPGAPAGSGCGTIAGQLVRSIGQLHVSGKGGSQSHLKSLSTSFEFEVHTDGVGNESIPPDFEGVSEFVRTIPSHVRSVNNGKGVPVAIHLLPLSELARSFKFDLVHTRIVQRLDETAIGRAIERLVELETVVRDLSNYLSLLERHAFCIPYSQIQRVRPKKKRAAKKENLFKVELKDAIVGIRDGSMAIEVLEELLEEIGTEDDIQELEGYRALMNEYLEKIAFASTVTAKGAKYFKYSGNKLNEAILENDTEDLYILYFGEALRQHPTWSRNHQVLLNLLDDPPCASRVFVVDLDIDGPKPKSSEPSPKAPYIEHRRGGHVIISDVAKDQQELEQRNIVRCDDAHFVERLTAHPPPGRRILRIPCPGQHCLARTKTTWICRNCRDLVAYGYTDEYLYCSCSRYLASRMVFKCRLPEHGTKFVKYEDQAHLRGMLQTPDSDEEYNILLLGKSGIGKSMFINSFALYNQFGTLDEAMNDPKPPRHPIPFSFAWQDQDKEDHHLAYGDESDKERFSTEGQSATRRTMVYNFLIKDKNFRIIDTPGILDTGGLDQDLQNLDDVFRTLKSFNKLSAVVFLLHPSEPRLDDSFKFCMTELFTHLHRDVAQNIIFGFTNASLTNFTLGATSAPLDQILRELETGISRLPSNQFFFDAGGFMFLSHYRETGETWPDKWKYDDMWKKSVKQADDLLFAVMRLPPHDLQKTLRLNQARVFLDGMAKPLTYFLGVMEKSKADMDRAKRELADLDVQGQNLREELAKVKITITVAVRYNLPRKRTVCSHPACATPARDADGKMCIKYKRICHDGCDIEVPDEIAGHVSLATCWPFRRWIFWSGYDCDHDGCGHSWKDHMRISYELRDEEREIYDPETTREIQSNAEAKQRIQIQSDIFTAKRAAIEQEQDQIYQTRAQIGLYLSMNSMGGACRDGSIGHYNYRITLARRQGREDIAAELEEQRREYEARLQALKEAVKDGTTQCPSEEAVEAAIEALNEMPIFGKYLRECIPRDHIDFDGERHVHVLTPKTRSRKFFDTVTFNYFSNNSGARQNSS